MFELEFKNLKGEKGAIVEAEGLFGFQIDGNGNLILSYSGDDVPDLSINDSGELIFTYTEEE